MALRGLGRRRDEVKEDVQAENNKGEPEEAADDDGGDFHDALFSRSSRIARGLEGKVSTWERGTAIQNTS